jgi:hypothetical protein
MTTACALVKLMFLLGQYPEDPLTVTHFFRKSLVGELSENTD